MRLCFVAHFAYGALSGGASGHIGGVERQTSLMAKWLSARGHEVSVLTWDEGQVDGARVDDVVVHTICRRDSGVRGIRFLHPRWTGLVSALNRANADVYYQNCGEVVTGQVAAWCRARSRRFVYSVASDPDCDPRLPLMMRRERVLYRFGLKRADRVIAQTERQRMMLNEGFGVKATVIPMPCLRPAGAWVARQAPGEANKRVLWLGRLVGLKRPERCLELAQSCPDIHFDLVGPWEDAALASRILDAVKTIPNVEVHGPADRAAVQEFLARAHCLVSTSESEGFPNTFLEAWSVGVPVVALVDPDGIIRRRGLGVAAADMPDLRRRMVMLLASPADWQRASSGALTYFAERHSVEAVMPQFEQLFLEQATLAVRKRA